VSTLKVTKMLALFTYCVTIMLQTQEGCTHDISGKN